MILLFAHTPLFAEALSATAERDIAISLSIINDQRNTTLAYNMSFTEEEKDAFWPLYRRYRDAMTNVAIRKLDVIVDYASHYENMTDTKAEELLDRSLIYEEQALKVKQLYVKKFRRILPSIKVTRLMQLESRMNAAIQLKLSEGIPLIQ
jgi:hypothetical protein